jgi:hypothetical protein
MSATNALRWFALSAFVGALALLPRAQAHCDTLDGPVVADARTAIQTGKADVVLKWVDAADESEARTALRRTLDARASPSARDLAETWFFETVVRLHRKSEGEPYTGLQPAGSAEPIIRDADAALERGDPTALTSEITGEIGRELRERFARVKEARPHKDESIAAGRAYVEAYVAYVHYVEIVHAGLRAAVHEG